VTFHNNDFPVRARHMFFLSMNMNKHAILLKKNNAHAKGPNFVPESMLHTELVMKRDEALNKRTALLSQKNEIPSLTSLTNVLGLLVRTPLCVKRFSILLAK
jgi:hypothetical protein